MKKLNIILVLFAFLTMALGFTACSDKEDDYMDGAKKSCHNKALEEGEYSDWGSEDECVDGMKITLESQKKLFPKCVDDFIDTYICFFDHFDDEDACDTDYEVYDNCIRKNYPNQYGDLED